MPLETNGLAVNFDQALLNFHDLPMTFRKCTYFSFKSGSHMSPMYLRRSRRYRLGHFSDE